jgi:hypothetical protein
MEVNSQLPGCVTTGEKALGTLWMVFRGGLGALEKRNRNTSLAVQSAASRYVSSAIPASLSSKAMQLFDTGLLRKDIKWLCGRWSGQKVLCLLVNPEYQCIVHSNLKMDDILGQMKPLCTAISRSEQLHKCFKSDDSGRSFAYILLAF